jgi:hypothetical protein
MVKELIALVPASPVSVTIAAPVATTVPTDPVPAKPVTATVAPALTVSVPKAEVPASPVRATDTLTT